MIKYVKSPFYKFNYKFLKIQCDLEIPNFQIWSNLEIGFIFIQKIIRNDLILMFEKKSFFY